MKTTLILLTTIFAAVLVGCSDNLNITDPLGGHNSYVQNQPNHPTDNGNGELLWSLAELKVWASSQSIAENKAVYNSPSPVPPLMSSGGYRVSFDVYTNANRTTNGYAPLAEVYKDEATMYSGSEFTSGGETSVHKEIEFKGDFSQIKFYIALFQVDGGRLDKGNMGDVTVDDRNEYDGNAKSVQLTLKNINIYRIK